MSTRWGFIGAGNIAKVALAPAVHNATNASLYAVASRDIERSRALNPVKVHQSYADLISDDDVDAIYISLSNDQHYAWSLAALRAGKHVLCEKPLALNALQVQEMMDVAQENNRLLTEAVWSRWHPRFIRAVEIIGSGEIGEINSIDSIFTFSADLTGNYRLDPVMGGGALLDVGLYQAHLWQALSPLAHAPRITHINREISSTGVDLTTEVSAVLASGVQVKALSSFKLPAEQKIVITGSSGTVEFAAGESFTSWRKESSLRINEQVENFQGVDAYQLMVEAFSAQIQGGDNWVLPIDDSLMVARVLDQIATHRA